MVVTNTFVSEARNMLADGVLSSASDDDLALWIDSDMVFNFDDMDRLIKSFDASDYDILSGLYFTRNEKDERVPLIYFASDEKNKFITGKPVDLPKEGIVKVDGVGFGFLVMKASVLKKLKSEHDKIFGWCYHDGEFVGEDITFCQRAAEAGFKIGVDLSIKLGHYGGVIRSLDS